MSEEDLSKAKQRQRAASPAIYLVAAVLAAIAGFGTVYVSFAPSDNGPEPSGDEGSGEGKGSAQVSTGPLAGLNKGAMAALLVRPKPLDLPELAFADANGASKSLADWRGKVVLLNIWATWCVPCRDEMPAIDKLETKLGGKDFEVVAVNIDKGGPERPASFLKEVGATHLALYIDPTGKLFSKVKTVGMPTTLVIDRNGKEIGRLIGPADWASPEALALIEAAITAPATGS
ncbi:MAG: TlpA family protein disulfide reductase [Methyloceanibacter sp.]|jgi:thiol-disulfide isomerase/thioredoxin|nr:TlpA family protein disulfide reductase [Methyloceanibacter sp.]